MRRLTSSDWENTSKPAIRAVPPLAGMKQDRIFIVVDLPAPLGPRKPTICPFSTLKETSWIAVTGPYRFVRWSTWIRSEEHTSELQSRPHLVCRLLLEK